MFSLAEISVVGGKSLNIKRVVRGISVLHQGELHVALLSKMQLRSWSVSFQLHQVPGRSSIYEDQVMPIDLLTQIIPQTSKPSRG